MGWRVCYAGRGDLAEAADEDTLDFYVEYSPDNGQSWQPVAVRRAENSVTLDVEGLAGSQQALVQVGANDGFHTTWSQSAAVFTVSDKRPTASILSPSDEQVYVTGQEIVLKGYGMDNEDGNLGDAALTWHSDRHADPLGTGKTLTLAAADLATGQHIITLVAVDSLGQSSLITETLTFEPEATEVTDRINIKVYRDRPVFPAELDVTPEDLIFNVTAGEAINSVETLVIRNGGDGDPITWTATTSDPVAVQLSSASGNTPAEITVSLDASDLQAGVVYTGTISIAAATAETREISAAEIPYTVNVEEGVGTSIYLPLIMKQ